MIDSFELCGLQKAKLFLLHFHLVKYLLLHYLQKNHHKLPKVKMNKAKAHYLSMKVYFQVEGHNHLIQHEIHLSPNNYLVQVLCQYLNQLGNLFLKHLILLKSLKYQVHTSQFLVLKYLHLSY